MNLGIDGRIFFKQGSGIGRYSQELIQYLIQNYKENKYTIYVPKNSLYKEKIKFKGDYFIKEIDVPIFSWYIPGFTDQLDKDKIDVYYITHPRLPHILSKNRKVRTVITCHGLIPKGMQPSLKDRIYWWHNMWCAMKYSDRVICVSQDTKNALHTSYRKPMDTMDVAYFGLDHTMKPLSKQGKLKAMKYLIKKYNIPNKEFVFEVAGPQGYKNVDTIVKAWEILKVKHNLEIPLIITRSSIKPNEYKNIYPLTWINYADVPLFYACSKLTIYPSLFEGIGFPVAESFACGTPCIISNISAMPECAGGAALIVDQSTCPECWANAICNLYKDKKLRKKLIKLGNERAKFFTWKKAAEIVLDSFTKAIVDHAFEDPKGR